MQRSEPLDTSLVTPITEARFRIMSKVNTITDNIRLIQWTRGGANSRVSG